jgi:hypothetical protein
MTGQAKPGHVDMTQWGDVDIEKARAAAEEKAAERWEKWADATLHSPCPKPWSHYSKLIETEGLSAEQAREMYGQQPAIKKYRASKNYSMGCPVEDMGFDREKYLESCRKAALVPFAVLKDGKWYERGQMGWWAIVSDEQDQDVWTDKVSELFDGLDPNTQVTAVDCHI